MNSAPHNSKRRPAKYCEAIGTSKFLVVAFRWVFKMLNVPILQRGDNQISSEIKKYEIASRDFAPELERFLIQRVRAVLRAPPPASGAFLQDCQMTTGARGDSVQS